MNDKLDLMFEQQKQLQMKLGNIDEAGHIYEHQKYINMMALALIDEVMEAVKETCWKDPDWVEFGWKHDMQNDVEAFQHELVDVLHFFINLCFAAGLDAGSLFSLYCKKHLINERRHEEGY